jgi:site-specific recombinase XerD
MTRFEELMKQFKDELLLRNYAENTINTYEGYLRMFFRAMNGKPKPLPLSEIKAFLLSINNMNTRGMYVITIRNFYNLVLKAPLSLDDIPYPRATNYLPVVLSIKEVQRLINATNNIKHKAILQLMYSCALRVSEPIAIKCSKQECHINPDTKTLMVKGAKGFKDRLVYCPTDTINLLRSYVLDWKPTKWLFEGQPKGETYSKRSIQQFFKAALKKAGIAKLASPHSLRHSRLTHLCDAGMDIYKLKEFAGHNNIKTTELYLHLAKQSLVNHAEIADLIIMQALNNSKDFKLEFAQ